MIRRRAKAKWKRPDGPEPAERGPGQLRDSTLAPGGEIDRWLMTLARNGNVSAFNELVELHSPIIFNVCVRLLRDAASAEDATQDTFIRAWSALKTWHGGNVRPWLIRIATNRCYDMLRSQARRPASSLDADAYEIEPRWSPHVEGPEDPEQFSIRADLSAYLERALALLPDDQRLAIILVDVHGLSYEEVAEVAGVAVGTVKSRISRARGRLRDQLRDGPDSAELFGEICRPHGEDDASRR